MSFFAVFNSKECKQLLRGRQILIVGDSVKRTMYKDIVCLYQTNNFLSLQRIQTKMESSHMGDQAIRCVRPPKGKSKKEQMDLVQETRLFEDPENDTKIYYVCIGASFGPETQEKIDDLEGCIDRPFDIVLVHSALWDLHIHDLENYTNSVGQLLDRLEAVIASSGRLYWLTSPPVLIDNIDELYKKSRRKSVAVKICNDLISLQIIRSKRHGIIDLSYWLEYLLFMQIEDKLHWNRRAHRLITNVILTNICRHFKEQLPFRMVFEDDLNLLPQSQHKLPYIGFREYYHSDSFADQWKLVKPDLQVYPKFPPIRFVKFHKRGNSEGSIQWGTGLGIDLQAKRTLEDRKRELKSLGIDEEKCKRPKLEIQGREMEMKIVFYGNLHCPSIENAKMKSNDKKTTKEEAQKQERSLPRFMDIPIPPLDMLLAQSKKEARKPLTYPFRTTGGNQLIDQNQIDQVQDEKANVNPMKKLCILQKLVIALKNHVNVKKTFKVKDSLQ